MRMMTPAQLENWHARARAVVARLSQLGIPCRLEAKYDGPDCVELQVIPSPLATVAMMELLADDLERNIGAQKKDPAVN